MQSLWMLLGTVFFAISGLTIKLASTDASLPMIIVFRGGMGLLVVWAWAVYIKGTLTTPHPWTHARRSVSGCAAIFLYTYAVTHLPLGTGTMLNYTSSIWLACLLCGVALWRGRALPSWALLACVGLGFVGVVLLLQPALDAGNELAIGLAYGLGLVSGLLSAIAYMQVKSLGQYQEPEWWIVFYHALVMTILATLVLFITQPFDAIHMPQGKTLWLLIANGLLASGGQWCLTRAYTQGGTLMASSLQYLTVVFATILGALVVGDVLTPHDYMAMGIIITSGVAASFFTLRSQQTATSKITSTQSIL